MSNMNHTKTNEVNLDAREGLTVPASWKTPTVLRIYTVKSGERSIVIWDMDNKVILEQYYRIWKHKAKHILSFSL